jgi:hypothetical protein
MGICRYLGSFQLPRSQAQRGSWRLVGVVRDCWGQLAGATMALDRILVHQSEGRRIPLVQKNDKKIEDKKDRTDSVATSAGVQALAALHLRTSHFFAFQFFCLSLLETIKGDRPERSKGSGLFVCFVLWKSDPWATPGTHR